MKQLNIVFDDTDHSRLVSIKGNRSWREFILTLVNKETNKDEHKEIN